MSNIIFGSYDPQYPNGIMSITDEKNIFGLRVLTFDIETGILSEGKSLDPTTYRIGQIYGDKYFHMEWSVCGKKASITWGRKDECTIYGNVSCEKGLKIILEQYIPREYRLMNSWANFSRLKSCIFTGEMISPNGSDGSLNAIRLLVNEEPESTCGYNERQAQLDDFIKTGRLRNIRVHNIWHDMGLSWLQGLEYSGGVSFEYKVGRAEDFLNTADNQRADEIISQGLKQIRDNEKCNETTQLTGYGILKDIPEVIRNLISFNTMFREDTMRRFIMVERTWARNEDGWGTIFNWDTFLSSLSTVWFDEELAKENILSAFDAQLSDGKIPLFTAQQLGHTNEPPVTAGRCQHIVQGFAVWKVYLRTKDKIWLKKCFDKLKKLHAWWFADRGDGQSYRDPQGLGLLGFGYDAEKEMGVLGATVMPYVAKAQFAYFETYDDSPQWTTGKYFKSVAGMSSLHEEDVSDIAKYKEIYHTANVYTLERCCLYALESKVLGKIAGEFGLNDEADFYIMQYKQMIENVNKYMWNEEDGCYYNYHFDGYQIKILTPDCFMPIMSGIADKSKTDRLLKILLDPEKFWGKWKIPSVSYDDPHFIEQKYWRGQIWPPMVLWTYLSLREAGCNKEAWKLAENSSYMLLREWRKNGLCPENYSAIDGHCGGDLHYNWGTLMGLIALEEMMQLTPDSVIFGNNYATEGVGLSGIELDGHIYDVSKSAGITTVIRDGKQIAQNKGPIVLKRTEKS